MYVVVEVICDACEVEISEVGCLIYCRVGREWWRLLQMIVGGPFSLISWDGLYWFVRRYSLSTISWYVSLWINGVGDMLGLLKSILLEVWVVDCSGKETSG